MNVYINRSFQNSNLFILVAANSKKEAWNYITHGKEGEYYFELYDYDTFSLIKDISANTDVPKIIYETTLIDNNFPF